MQFCPIFPLDLWEEIQKIKPANQMTLMALAQFCDQERYKKFFSESSDIVILDNGAYEKAEVHSVKLMRLATDIGADYMVLPDDPTNWARSIHLSRSFPSFPESDMWVVHTDGNLKSSVESYMAASTSGAAYIAFSRLTKAYGTEKPGTQRYERRTLFIRHLKDIGIWDERKKHHCLGMADGDVRELPLLVKEGIDSIDSSSPVWRGLHGYNLRDISWPDYEFNPYPQPIAYYGQWRDNLREVYNLCS